MIDLGEWIDLVFTDARSKGTETAIECPKCGPSKSGSPNASVNYRKQKWHCWKCNAGGSAAYLVALIEGCSPEEAYNIVDLERSSAPEEAPEVQKDVSLPPECLELYKGRIKGNLTRGIHEYAESRGWTKEIARHYKLSYAITGRYRGRIIIPFTEDRHLVGFQGRTVLPVRKGSNPKYFGPPVSHTLFNIDNQHKGKVTFLHEGPADAIATGGLARLGKYVTHRQLALLLRLKPNLIIWGDKDAKDDDIKLAGKLIQHFPRLRIYMKHVAHDAAAATAHERATAISNSLKVSKSHLLRLKNARLMG